MNKGAEGERFLAAFGRLKAAVEDDPTRLDTDWEDTDQVPGLCDELASLVRRFELLEEWSPLAFTNNVSAASAKARRDYDDRWREPVWKVANRKLLAVMDEFLADLIDVEDEPTEDAETPDIDVLGASITEWKDDASEEASQIDQMIDYVSMKRDMDDHGDFDWVEESLVAWDRLKVSGLDLAGTLWRRRALPHVLVPVHVAKHYGASRHSLHRRLHQAGKAFVFGAPLAALALQRAVIEEVLDKHWGAGKGWVRDANLPELAWEVRAHRLKRLANDALHGDPEKLSPDELDRSIIENFLLLRLLIEQSPEDLAKHVEARS